MGTSFTAGEIITLQGEVFDRLIALLKEKQYDEKIQELRERLHTLQAQEKIRVAFVGQYSAGKSSIVSALTGQEVAIRIMFRKCEHCKHRYTYNPSTGKFGLICPKCHKAQSHLISVEE